MEGSDGDVRGGATSTWRGRNTMRSLSPAASRRRSRAARTPPSSPDSPSSPLSVLPSSPASKADSALAQLLTDAPTASPPCAAARRVLQLLAPPRLITTRSPSRLPGFEGPSEPASPAFLTPPTSPVRTPLFIPAGPLVRTPPSTPARQAQPILAPLFALRERVLLGSPPMSSPPRRPADRRKTLAGTTVARTYGFSLCRAGTRTSAWRKAAPVANKAEVLVCQSLGIINKGQIVTSQALDEFARRFDGQVSQEVIAAVRDLFKLDDPQSAMIDEALLEHGGAAALDAVEEEDLANV